MRTVVQGEIYRHFKDKLYQIVAVAYHSETREKYVVYQALYGDFKTYIRPYDMFLSEVDHEKYPEVKQLYRFQKVDPETELAASCIPHATVTTETEAAHATSIDSVPVKSVSATEKPSAVVTEEGAEENTGVNPLLLDFFDCDSTRDKIEYLQSIHTKLDQRLIDDIAASMDLTVDEGDVDTRYMSLLNALRTRARYETGRLR